jgi:hypothetical protein
MSIAAHTAVDPMLEAGGFSHGAASGITDVGQLLVNPLKIPGLAAKGIAKLAPAILPAVKSAVKVGAAGAKIGSEVADPVHQQIQAAQAHADANPIRLNLEAPSPKQFAPNRRSFARAEIRRQTESEQRSMRHQTHVDIGPQ